MARNIMEELKMINKYMEQAAALSGELSAWRRALHQIPEIGLELPRTAAYVSEQLTAMGIEHTISEGCNIVALIGQGDRCFMLRSDMDALPMREESGEEFASVNGNMHACGHDMHTAILLGAARLLKDNEADLKGTVKLLFQSGEEVFRGASTAISEGVLQDPAPEAAFCMHVDAINDVGLLAYGSRPMSSVYGFKIKISGKGAHGSTPEQGVDPIATAVHIYLALQELIAREISASQEAALTIGHIEAGSVPNAIPDSAMMEGTLRTFDPDVREHLISRISEVTESVARTYRASADIEVLYDVPVCVCDDAINKEGIAATHAVNDELMVLDIFHSMGSEDFSFFTDKLPCSYMAICAGAEEGKRFPAHNPKVRFNEKALPIGAAIYATVATEHFLK